jgi:hypothetical protein
MRSTKVAEELKKLQEEAIYLVESTVSEDSCVISSTEIIGVKTTDDMGLCLNLSMKIRNITDTSIESLLPYGRVAVLNMRYRKLTEDHIYNIRFQTYYICFLDNAEDKEKTVIKKELSEKSL